MMWDRILDGKPARFLEAKAELEFAGEQRIIDIGEEPTAILNVGLGNGEWAFDVGKWNDYCSFSRWPIFAHIYRSIRCLARNYPKTRVLGVDLCIPARIV